jgi:hypothetical protein
MRKQLALAEGERKKIRAQVSRFGKKTNYKGHSEETILLKGIVDVETNDVVADHLWFSLTKSFEKLVLKEGMLVEFEARVKIYKKGYVNSRYKIDNSKKDFKLSHPTKIKVIPQNE